MPWNSTSFINSTSTWFSSLADKLENETAQTIADTYLTSAVASQTFFAATPNNLKQPSVIQQGFNESFNIAKLLNNGKLTVDVWLPAANSIITFWTGTSFNLTLPPGGLAGISNTIISAGLAISLAADLKTAFEQDTGIDSALKLNEAFVKHLSTINGLWVGTAPGAPPPPLSVSWTGLT